MLSLCDVDMLNFQSCVMTDWHWLTTFEQRQSTMMHEMNCAHGTHPDEIYIVIAALLRDVHSNDHEREDHDWHLASLLPLLQADSHKANQLVNPPICH